MSVVQAPLSPASLLVPDWPAPARVAAVQTTRIVADMRGQVEPGVGALPRAGICNCRASRTGWTKYMARRRCT